MEKSIIRFGWPSKTWLTLLIFCFSLKISAQTAPSKQWDRSFGGNNGDGGTSLQQTLDGGYIIGGSSDSGINGDKSQICQGINDYWVIKIDANGNKLWDKTFGGNGWDNFSIIQQTLDGGYILGGTSTSDISGNKSQSSRGDYDYWVVKIDASGNKLWDKTFGGNGYDELHSLQQTSDGGFILGGQSDSGISIDKSQPSITQGYSDFWVIKIDASGNKLWDKTFGGNSQDILFSLGQSSDGGYLLAGSSISDISSDKTQTSKGGVDYWIIKLDVNGNKQWDKTIGGSSDDWLNYIQLTVDGGYILGGMSVSNISGDKSQVCQGIWDYWIIKLDASGSKIWDKTFGGSAHDQLRSIKQTVDGGFIVGGISLSGISVDKSQACQGLWDYWVIRLDPTGNKLWDKTFGGNNSDELYSLQQTSDGGYIFGGHSASDIGVDKSQVSKGNEDYWIVKLAAELNYTNWTGSASSIWNNAANWSNGVPNSGSIITIPIGVPNLPLITSGTIYLQDIIINQGATLTQTGGTLNITGNFTNNGTFSATGGTVSFTGTALQTISGSSTTTFNNLTIGSSGVSLSAPVEVKQLLTLNGDLTTNSQPLTLLSDINSTAMVVNSGGVVNGNATVQRYITPSNAGAGYRHFSSPVANSTIADFTATGFAPAVNTAYNALPTPNISAANFPNVFEYDETRITATYPGFDIGWKSPVALTSALEIGKGYDVNIHGASKSDLVGTLNNGTISVSNLTNGGQTESGWHLLGNPYPAPIDWDLITLPTGLNNALYMFKSTSAYAGSYRSYVNGVGNTGDNIIPAMQGFFVRNSGTSPVTFTFTNASRLTSYANPNFYRQAETRHLVQLNLKDGQNRSDATFIYFQQSATPAVDNTFDAYKVYNTNGSPNLYTKTGNAVLSINGLPELQQSQIVNLGSYFSQPGNYVLEASQVLNFAATENVLLEDRELNVFQDLKVNPTYAFTAAFSDTARFYVHFNRNISGVKEAVSGPEVLIYPNPATSEINLTLTNLRGETELAFYNVIGQNILTKTLGKNEKKATLNISALAKGVYQLRIKSENVTLTRKIVVQ